MTTALQRGGYGTPRPQMANLQDKAAIEAVPFDVRCPEKTVIALMALSAKQHANSPAITFILKGSATAKPHTWSYKRLWDEVTALANGLKAVGHETGETVAYILPNLPETLATQYAAQAIGCGAPINPLLEPEVIAGILKAVNATTLVTLKPFVKTDLSQKATTAARLAPNVRRIIEIDMLPYVDFPISLIAPLLRPKRESAPQGVKVLDYNAVTRQGARGAFSFKRDITPETHGTYFHTGGTTGIPKVAVHKHGSMVFDSFMVHDLLYREDDVILSALPLFHVFSSYVMATAPFFAGAHVVLCTPSGFRGEGVMDNFWKLAAHYKATALCAVPTALATLDQRPIDADVSMLRFVVCGSAALPTALFHRFEAKTGVKILEGYGMTEGTCVTSCNPPDGTPKIGSVGFPIPYVKARISNYDDDDKLIRHCETNEIGEICFQGPCVFGGYLDPRKTAEVFAYDDDGRQWLRTGDLGRIDEDGYIWITGRRKDLIIRGGHNIDPGLLEEALAEHPDVAFAGVIGQPDKHAGEIPCAYVELTEGGNVDVATLKAFSTERISERAARAAYIEVIGELPKTAVGKVFKPALRKWAIARVYTEALKEVGVAAEVAVIDDETRGLTAIVKVAPQDAHKVSEALSGFTRPFRLA